MNRSAFAKLLRAELAIVTPDGARKYRLGENVSQILQVFLERKMRKHFYNGGRLMRKLKAQTLKASHLDFVAQLS